MNISNSFAFLIFFIISIISGYFTLDIPFFANDYFSAINFIYDLINNDKLYGLFRYIGDGHRYRPLYIAFLSILHFNYNDSYLFCHLLGFLTIFLYGSFNFLIFNCYLKDNNRSFFISLFTILATIALSEFIQPLIGNLLGTCFALISFYFYIIISSPNNGSVYRYLFGILFLIFAAFSFFTIWSTLIFLPVFLFVQSLYFKPTRHQIIFLAIFLLIFLYPSYYSIGGIGVLLNSPILHFSKINVFEMIYYFSRSSEIAVLFIGMPGIIFIILSSIFLFYRFNNIIYAFPFIMIIAFFLHSPVDPFTIGVLFGNAPINASFFSILSAFIVLLLFILNLLNSDKMLALSSTVIFLIVFSFPFLIYLLTGQEPPIMGLYYTPIIPFLSFYFIHLSYSLYSLSRNMNLFAKYSLLSFIFLTFTSTIYYISAVTFNVKQLICAMCIVDMDSKISISSSVKMDNQYFYEIYFDVSEYNKYRKNVHMKSYNNIRTTSIAETFNLNWYFMPYAEKRVKDFDVGTYLLMGRQRPLKLGLNTKINRYISSFFRGDDISYPYSLFDQFKNLWLLSGPWVTEPDYLPGEKYLNQNTRIVSRHEIDFERIPFSPGEAIITLLSGESLPSKQLLYSTLYFIDR